jgi:predicted nucleic acid-binding protein
MVVIADTSPLNYLISVDSIWILQQLYGNVIVPAEVRDELVAQDAPPAVRTWANNLPEWVDLNTCDPALREDPRWCFLRRHAGVWYLFPK